MDSIKLSQEQTQKKQGINTQKTENRQTEEQIRKNALLQTEKEVIEEEQEGNLFDLDISLEEVRVNTDLNMPEKHSVKLSSVEDLMRRMLADTKSASGYKKVRAAAKLYFEEKNETKKMRALYNMYRSAEVYLRERTESSKKSRKDNCELLIKDIGRYMQTTPGFKEITGEDYVLKTAGLTDEEIDAEIRLAYDTAMKGKYADVSDRTRRNAFKRKIADVRKASSLFNERNENDAAMDEIIKNAREKYGTDEPEDGVEDYDSKVINESVKAYMKLFKYTSDVTADKRLSKETTAVWLIQRRRRSRLC